MKNKVALYNLGCKVNSYEVDSMKEQLSNAGYDIVDFNEKADIYIVNTCTVTNIADRKSRQMLSKAKNTNPNAIVIATGCYSQASKDDLEDADYVDYILGNSYKGKIVSAIEDFRNNIENNYFSDINLEKEFEDIPISKISGHIRAYMKIQDGCNRFCSYCIIPYVRGRVRSRSIDSIYEEAMRLSQNGVTEIVLTGIQLSAYGFDLKTEELSLDKVVYKLSKIEGIKRIRLGSLDPNVITEEFVDNIFSIDKFCPHFHLSLQSGSDAVLRRMNRHYNTEEYYGACKILRNKFDNPAITTDIIVGFPGETEQEFNETLDFVNKIELAQTHIFKYSMRKGTKASVMDNQIDEKIKALRAKKLSEITDRLELKYLHGFIGKSENILLEDSHVEINGEIYTIGHTKRYVRVALKGKLEKNQLLAVNIYNIDEDKKILISRRRDEL